MDPFRGKHVLNPVITRAKGHRRAPVSGEALTQLVAAAVRCLVQPPISIHSYSLPFVSAVHNLKEFAGQEKNVSGLRFVLR